MPVEIFSNAVVQFLRKNIYSIRQLETLLFLYSNSEKSWTVVHISRSLAGNVAETHSWLEKFSEDGLIKKTTDKETTYQFVSSLEENNRIVTELANDFKVRPMRVMELIVNDPMKKMSDLRHAFRIKKDGDENDS